MEPAVIDPPCGKMTNVMKLSAVARATKMAISASIIGENVGLTSVVLMFFPPPVLPGSGSLGRQRF
jgi:hypothetical protein